MVKGPNDLPVGAAPAGVGGSTLSPSLLLRVRAGDQAAWRRRRRRPPWRSRLGSRTARWCATPRTAAPPDAGQSRTVLDLVLQTQDLLRERLRPWSSRRRAVGFSSQGKARGG
jgi:hypothetical protein